MILRSTREFLVVTLCLCLVASGCKSGSKKVAYVGDADLEYYRNEATQIAYPAVCQSTSPQVEASAPPRTLDSRHEDEIWDVSLQEAIKIALQNSEIIKSAGQFLNPQNVLLTNSAQVPSVLDPAIQESGILFGNRGVEAALSDFDTNWNVNTTYGRNEQIQNNLFGTFPNNTNVATTGSVNTGLSKNFAYGANLALNHNVDYTNSNQNQLTQSQLFDSFYQTGVSATYTQQLLAGSGADYVRVAGPVSSNANFGSITGVSQGVLIARINQDITLTDFETNVRNLLRDVETSYWNLYLAYRNFDVAVRARNSSLQTWRIAKVKRDNGGLQGFSNWQEPQARDRYFETKAQVETALASIYQTEQGIRNLLQLPVNDGRIMRPVDEPLTVSFKPDWYLSLAEALTERVELRRQKWQIKSTELQLMAAKNIARPRLDLIASYNVNGFGDQLFPQEDDDVVGTSQGLNGAYETLLQGNQTGYTVGLQYSQTLGLRATKSQVRNLELRLAKSRKVHAAQELEISHEMAVSFQELSRTYTLAKSNFSRRHAAMERAQLLGEEYAAGANLGQGEGVIDRYLRAQESLAAAENSYYQSLIDYNLALLDFQFRKGTLLKHDSVHLLEGEWVPEAYQQALARAWARSHAIDLDSTESSPPPFASSVPVSNGVSFIDHVMPVEGSTLPPLPSAPASQDGENPSPQADDQFQSNPNQSNTPIDNTTTRNDGFELPLQGRVQGVQPDEHFAVKSLLPEDHYDLRSKNMTTLAEWQGDHASMLENNSQKKSTAVTPVAYQESAQQPTSYSQPSTSPQEMQTNPHFKSGVHSIGESLKSLMK